MALDSHQLYCPHCQKKTSQVHLVTQFATQCLNCGNTRSGLERVDTERHVYYTPDGHEGTLVENTPDKAVFLVEQGDYAGLYVYDKHTGFGAIQQRPPMHDPYTS